MSFPLLYFDKNLFMDRILTSSKDKFEITEFENIITQTEQEFFRSDNDSCMIFGENQNEVFLSMKLADTDDKNPPVPDHIAAKVDLVTNEIVQLSKNHKTQILSYLLDTQTGLLITGGWDQHICVYNSSNLKFIKKILVGKGEIDALMLKQNSLFIGTLKFVSILNLTQINSDQIQSELIKHIQLSNSDVHLSSIAECGKYDLWLNGIMSNKIYRMTMTQDFEIRSK